MGAEVTDSPRRGDKFSPEGWSLVHQGGHHNVYCDGLRHVKTGGGFVGIDPPSHVRSTSKCDCAAWAARKAGL